MGGTGRSVRREKDDNVQADSGPLPHIIHTSWHLNSIRIWSMVGTSGLLVLLVHLPETHPSSSIQPGYVSDVTGSPSPCAGRSR